MFGGGRNEYGMGWDGKKLKIYIWLYRTGRDSGCKFLDGTGRTVQYYGILFS